MYKPFFVWQNRVLHRVNAEDVVYIFTEKNYTRIILSDNSVYMVRSTLSATLKKLPPGIFIKVHRSFAASIYFIDKIARDHLTIGEDSMPIGKRYYKSLISQLTVIE